LGKRWRRSTDDTYWTFVAIDFKLAVIFDFDNVARFRPPAGDTLIAATGRPIYMALCFFDLLLARADEQKYIDREIKIQGYELLNWLPWKVVLCVGGIPHGPAFKFVRTMFQGAGIA